MHQYKKIPNMRQLPNFDTINDALKPHGAKTSIKSKCRQLKADGYIGNFFEESYKPVYDFDIVSIKNGKSFANIHSDIYRTIPREVMEDIREYFIETSKAIYI